MNFAEDELDLASLTLKRIREGHPVAEGDRLRAIRYLLSMPLPNEPQRVVALIEMLAGAPVRLQ